MYEKSRGGLKAETIAADHPIATPSKVASPAVSVPFRIHHTLPLNVAHDYYLRIT